MADWTENMLFVRGSMAELETWNRILLEGNEEIGKLSFEKLIPRPEDEGDWYRWNINNWGVKWDTSPYGSAEKIQDGYLYAFMTPWDAPIKLIENLTNIHKGLNFELRYIFQYTDQGGIFCNSQSHMFTDLNLNGSVQPDLFEKLLLEPFKGYRQVFSMFG